MNMARSRSTNDRTRSMREAVRKPMQTCRVGIEDILAEFPSYGYRRITHELRRRGQLVNHKRVSRVMREQSRPAAYAHGSHTNSKHSPVLNPVRSLRWGRNSGWQISPTSDSLPALFFLRSCSTRGRAESSVAISHLLDTASAWPRSTPRSYLGGTIPTAGFNTRLKHTAHGLLPTASEGSMSRRGNPYDNAHVESFFKTLKHEEIFANDYSTIDDVADRLPHFLEEVYNRRRLHSSLGYMPPEEFESIHAA